MITIINNKLYKEKSKLCKKQKLLLVYYLDYFDR